MPEGGPGFMRGGRGRGGMFGGGRDRGGRGFSPPGEGGDNGRDRFARFEGMLRGFDANKDGVIDPNEVPEDRRRFLGFIGGRMGVDFSKPVAIDKLREKAAERLGGGANIKKEPEPLVPGFGVSSTETTVLAFGERAPESSGSSSGAGADPALQDPRIQGFADGMMRRYDRDGNGVLEKSKGEWEGVRGDPDEIDTNNDDRIDRNEMVVRIAAYMSGDRGRREGRGDDRGSDRQDGEESLANEDGRKRSYRFLSAAERLPEGLPDWFKERDRNQDGQVSMAEYSSYWSDSKAREYLRYDLNDDGVVTPDECLVAMSDPANAAPAADTSETPPTEAQGSDGAAKSEEKKEEKKESSGAKPWWKP